MPKKLKEILLPTICLFSICVIVAIALGFTNMITASKIEELNKKTAEKAMNQVLPANKYIKKDEDIYIAKDESHNICGYVIITAAKGYGGEVKVMTGINKIGKVTAIEILDCTNETPGLGQNAKNKSFVDQYKGKEGKLIIKQDIDAITGATITSSAVTDSVNKAMDLYQDLVKGDD